ncbi:hypothetical protein ACF9IK_10190 [Kitasatospora hibisci]|uniref:hypothetical protein n=1 Tax=Kitasatospora hibisci TaxID=3369522 RepID=UPI003754E95A
MAAESLGGHLASGHGRLHTLCPAVNGASAQDVDTLFDLVDDLNRIAGILQEQAEARHSPPATR